ncbi:MAG: hypothetical protein HFF09_07115 [Oscillospiraceae bacterium]|nr:hypothetical protein [Oscillospiraceae bacterium]
MRRYHHLRFDIWLCLLLGFLVSMGTAKIAEKVLDRTYESYVESRVVADGDIGGKAGEAVFRAQSVDDLLNHDTFTIVSPGIEYRNRGGGYYESWYMQAVTLPSGELVAAVINEDSVQYGGESIFDGDNVLPVGKVVYADLSANESFLGQIEYSEKLSSHDFYIDMLGGGGTASKETYSEAPMLAVQLGTLMVCFAVFHMIGAKLGLFPAFFSRRRKQDGE